MKKILLVSFLTFLFLLPIKVDALSSQTSGTKKEYIKVIHSNLSRINDVEISMSQEDYESELNAKRAQENSGISTYATNSSTTEFKTLTFTYTLVSGSRYKFSSVVNWDTIPSYRQNDFMVYTYPYTATTDTYYQKQVYVKSGTSYTINEHSTSTMDYLQGTGIQFEQAYINSNNGNLEANGALFDLTDESNVTSLKTYFSMYINNLNTSSRFCITDKHQDSNTYITLGTVDLFISSNDGSAKHAVYVGYRSYAYNHYDNLFSKHTVCFN